MTRPVAVRVSQATRLTGSSARQASRMASEILSGWPSVTDSEVNKKRFLDGKCISPLIACASDSAPPALGVATSLLSERMEIQVAALGATHPEDILERG